MAKWKKLAKFGRNLAYLSVDIGYFEFFLETKKKMSIFGCKHCKKNSKLLFLLFISYLGEGESIFLLKKEEKKQFNTLKVKKV